MKEPCGLCTNFDECIGRGFCVSHEGAMVWAHQKWTKREQAARLAAEEVKA